ncbi:MAG: ABC transporter ATP-binding protein [Cyclobacteriaceae bacterium]|nr:ABC transporter ATP-binding protein [Cyclobacteriaceae bacterium]
MIRLENVNKTYHTMGGQVHALKDASLSVEAGDNVVIIGKSGSGKSTLLNIITGIDRAESGQVIVNGSVLTQLNESELAIWRGKSIGIVFQFYQLLPTLSAADNILFAMELVGSIPTGERRARAENLLNQVGLADKRKKYPNELSGGEKQRVAIARALANDPPILVADEPTGNLDSKTSDQIHQLFLDLNTAGKTIIKVTHENIEHLRYNRVFSITDGRIKDNLAHPA